MKNYYICAPLSFKPEVPGYAIICNAALVPARSARLHFNTMAFRMWVRACRPYAPAGATPRSYFTTGFWAVVASVFLVFSITCRAQENITAPPGNVTAFAQNENYTWTGTYNGVTRVNKKNRKQVHFTTNNSALPSNCITSICCRSNGEVWIGTAKGILRYDGYAFIVVNTENSALPDEHITSMEEDASGDLWIGTCKGLVKVHGSRYAVYDHHNSQLNSDRVCLETDERGEINIKLGPQLYLPLKELTWAKR